MNANKVIPENLVGVRYLWEIHLYTVMGGPITVERLKCCDWSLHKFIFVNFSKLTDSNQIFRIDFPWIHYLLCEISSQIIGPKFFGPYELSITNYSMVLTLLQLIGYDKNYYVTNYSDHRLFLVWITVELN